MLPALSEILPEEKRRLHELELQFNEVERGSSYNHIDDVSLGLSEMCMRFDQLDKLVQSEPKDRREDCKRRIMHLRNSHQHIKVSLDSWIRRNRQYNFDSQKKDLFGGADLEGGTMRVSAVAEGTSLGHSSNMMNDYIASGQETLSNLLSQRERLKNVHRKVFDILNYLGLSTAIMKNVERRDSVDRLIVFGGMFFIIALIVFVYMYLRK
jgi:golgi SNAP receptor complex member 2